jgi:hypothetical protein
MTADAASTTTFTATADSVEFKMFAHSNSPMTGKQ